MAMLCRLLFSVKKENPVGPRESPEIVILESIAGRVTEKPCRAVWKADRID